MSGQYSNMHGEDEAPMSNADLERLRIEMKDRADSEGKARALAKRYRRHDDQALDREDIERGVMTDEELEQLRDELASVESALPSAEARAEAEEASESDTEEHARLASRKEELEELIELYGRPTKSDDAEADVTIRPTLKADTDAIRLIAVATGLFPSEALDEMISGYFGATKTDIWLTAVIDDQPVGFGFCEPERMTDGTWNLLAIGVLPDRQSQGVGASLLRHLEAQLDAAGQRVLLVETIDAPEFVRTRTFYLSNGFVEEARIREFYEAGADKLVFWKRLEGV